MKRVAINGLGRIGRMVLRHYMEARPEEIELVTANHLGQLHPSALQIYGEAVSACQANDTNAA